VYFEAAVDECQAVGAARRYDVSSRAAQQNEFLGQGRRDEVRAGLAAAAVRSVELINWRRLKPVIQEPVR
jgi:hypothetical protein